MAINTLINEAVDIFIENEEAILNDNFTSALLDKSKYEAQIDDIIKISVDKVYLSKEVVDKEIMGYKVINTLLNTYVSAINNSFSGKASNYDKLILKAISSKIVVHEESLYNRLLNVCNYVASLSDSRAILDYKKIEGIDI